MTVPLKTDLLFVGVDGGGTGCRARIEDAAGNVVGQGLSGPATTRLGIAETWASIERAFRAAAAEAGLGADDLARDGSLAPGAVGRATSSSISGRIDRRRRLSP